MRIDSGLWEALGRLWEGPGSRHVIGGGNGGQGPAEIQLR